VGDAKLTVAAAKPGDCAAFCFTSDIMLLLLGGRFKFKETLSGPLARWLAFPFGSPYSPPSDRTGKDIARLLSTESEAQERLTDGVYISNGDDASGRVHVAFRLALATARAESAVRNAIKSPVNFENYERLMQKALESGVITEEQATTVHLAQEAARRSRGRRFFSCGDRGLRRAGVQACREHQLGLRQEAAQAFRVA
jgi:hypothetical protein